MILELIAEARRHMHPASRLYLPVHTLTDYHTTLRAALRDYEARLVGIAPLPVKPFVVEYLDYYRRLHEAGVIHIFRDGAAWFSWGYVYELRLAGRGSDRPSA